MRVDERHLEERLVDQHLDLMLFVKKKAQARNGARIRPEALCELLRASEGYVSAAQLLRERFGREALLRRHHEEVEALFRSEKEVLHAEGPVLAREHPAFFDRHDGRMIVPLIGNAEFAELPFYDFIRLFIAQTLLAEKIRRDSALRKCLSTSFFTRFSALKLRGLFSQRIEQKSPEQ